VVSTLRGRTLPNRPPVAAVAPIAPGARIAPWDRQAFAALYEGYFDPIYRYCYARLGSQERAEDAAHQVFVRALEAIGRYQEGGHAREWLFVIAHNVIANETARRTAASLTLEDDIPDTAASPERLALDATERRALREAVARLPTDMRLALELRIAGLTGHEVAAEMGRSVAAVKMLQGRAIARLRAELGDRGGGCDGA
jgi:RNA polymerase sigma-70 factor (ECF subfamily)